MPVRVPSKKQTLLAFLQRGVAMVHVDARRPGVSVPAQFVGEAHLRLNLSYRYHITDLDIGDARVRATLSFGGQPFQCTLPWEAVFGITSHASGDGQVWPEDLPVEVMQTMAEQDEAGGKGEAGPKAPHALVPVRATRPTLAAVSEEPTPAPSAPEGPQQGAAAEPKLPDEPPRRHLRLVH